MSSDRVEGLRALLVETEAAHGTYEATVLNGVYDKDWAQWYAGHAVEHGIGALIGHDVAADRLADSLASAYAEYEGIAPGARVPWAAYTARRIAADL